MKKRTVRPILYTMLVAGITVSLFSVAYAAARGNIDPVDKWAWSTNAGWISFAPACTSCEGVTVYPNHLEGYAWGENIGWIRMGTYTGGEAHTYGNTSATDYGVNREGDGTLSGYAWGTNVGWINFDPEHGGVTIDPANGSFDGYAWAENVGWIRFKGPGYNVVVSAYRVYLPVVVRDVP
jgi:hypothetical protein